MRMKNTRYVLLVMEKRSLIHIPLPFLSYTNTCSLFPGSFTVDNIGKKQVIMTMHIRLWIYTFLQKCMAVLWVSNLKKKKQVMKNFPIILPYINLATYHAHPIILSTTTPPYEWLNVCLWNVTELTHAICSAIVKRVANIIVCSSSMRNQLCTQLFLLFFLL
jgi:hypothetical protein